MADIKVRFLGEDVSLTRALTTLDSKIGDVAKRTEGNGKRMSGAFSSFLGNLGAMAASNVFDKVFSVGKDALAEAEEAQKVSGITGQLVKQTGADSWTSSKQIATLATSISNKVGIDHEQIQSGENVLLTFRAVRDEAGKGNDIFTRATKVGVDLSAVMGGDLAGANKMLGKALQDPVKGSTALARAGVQLTDQQKDQIKAFVASGDQLDAQKIILKEVETQVGGTAAKGATATEKLGVMWKNVEEQLGDVLLPVLSKVTGWLGDHLPGAIDMVEKAWGRVWPAVKGAWDSVGAPVFKALEGAISTVVGWFSGGDASSQLGGGFSKALGVLKSVWTSVGKPAVDLVVDAFGQLSAWWSKNGSGIIDKVQEIAGKVGTVLSGLGEVIGAVLGIIKGLWDRFGGDILTVVTGAWDAISGVVSAAMTVIKGIIDVVMGIIHGDWGRVWDGIKEIFGGVWDGIVAILKGAWEALQGVLGAIWDGFTAIFGKLWGWLTGAASAAWDGIVGIVKAAWDSWAGVLGAIRDGIMSVLGGVWNWITSTASAVWGAVVGFFQSGWARLTGVLGAVKAGIVAAFSGAWDWLKSTAKGAIDWVVGIFSGIGKRIGGAIGGIADLITRPFKAAFNGIANIWNDTIGRLHFKIPSWVPVLGGDSFSVPNIPEFHTGGTFNSGQGEGLAVLKDGETIRTTDQERSLQLLLGTVPAAGVGGQTRRPANSAFPEAAAPQINTITIAAGAIVVQAGQRNGRQIADEVWDGLARKVRENGGARLRELVNAP